MKITLLPILLLLAHLTQAQTDLKAGLVAYYPFNGNANDESGNGYHPVAVKATFTTDRFGQANAACQFNGTSDFIRIRNKRAFQFNGPFSITAWVMVKGFYEGKCHGNRILMKGSMDNAYSGNYTLTFDDNYYTEGENCYIDKPNKTHQNFYGAGSTVISKDYIIPNKWYQLTYIFDGTYALLYVNCQLYGKGYAKGQRFDNNEDIYLGKMDHVQYPYWFNGLLDDLRFYNRALNKNEITALCKEIPQKATPPCTGENAVSAKFDYTINTCTTASFKLSNPNTKNISKAIWSFGDGTTLSGLSASHVYKRPGTYTVRAMVASKSGCADTAVRKITIKPLTTDFTYTEQGGPGSFQFNATNKNVFYSWDLGDGTSIGNEPSVTHTYTKNGQYTVRLFAQSNTDCRDTAQKVITVDLPKPPSAPVTKTVDPPVTRPVIAKPKLDKRATEIIKTIPVQSDSVNISLYDNGVIDGDSITLIYNDEIILTHHLLSEKPLKLTLKIDPDRESNELVMYAENQGSIPPNTALIIIEEGKKRHELNLSSSKEKSQAISFTIKR